MKQEGTASGLVIRNLGCTLQSPGGGGGGRGLLKILIPRPHSSPVTSESLEDEVQASVLFKALWVIAMCSSHVQEPLSQLESPAYSEAVVGKTKVL